MAALEVESLDSVSISSSTRPRRRSSLHGQFHCLQVLYTVCAAWDDVKTVILLFGPLAHNAY